MAGHKRGKGGSTLLAVAPPDRNLNVRRRKERAAKRQTVKELKQLLDVYEVQAPLNVGTLPDVLDECLRRAVGDMRYAAAQVDNLDLDDFWVKKVDAQGNVLVEPHPWVQLEQLVRAEVADLASRMMGLDLDARRVALAEAQAALLQRALKSAIESVGLTREQRKALGPALREARAMLEGQAIEGSATEVAA